MEIVAFAVVCIIGSVLLPVALKHYGYEVIFVFRIEKEWRDDDDGGGWDIHDTYPVHSDGIDDFGRN